MDKRIIWFTVIILLIGGGIFLFRYYSKEHSAKELGKLNFSVSPQTLSVEDSISFEDNTPGAKTWKWEFGDAGGIPDFRKKGTYKFYDAGRYILRLTVNGKTTDSSTTIIVNPKDGRPAIGAKVIISGPDRAYIGDPVTFTDNTPGAKHTNWQNTDMGEIKKDSKTYTTVFTHKGDFQIIAENEQNKGSDGQGIKKIHVTARPVKADPAPEAAPVVAATPPPKKEKPVSASPPPPPPVAKPAGVSDNELTTYFKGIAARQDAFRSNYALIKKAVEGDESIPIKIVKKSDGSILAQKPGLFGGCQHLNMMQLTVNKVTTERDPADNNSIKSITITVNE